MIQTSTEGKYSLAACDDVTIDPSEIVVAQTIIAMIKVGVLLPEYLLILHKSIVCLSLCYHRLIGLSEQWLFLG